MKTTTKLFFYFLTSSLFFFYSCTNILGPDHHESGTTTNRFNSPVITIAPNAFSFIVNSNNYSYNKEYNVNFSSDSLSIITTVTGNVNGNGNFAIKDSTDKVLFSGDLSAGINTNVTTVNSIPYKIMVSLNNFTGELTLTVATKTKK